MENEKSVYGIQGGVGSFNEEAIRHYFHTKGVDGEIAYLYTAEAVLTQLEAGEIDYGLFAIHNSIGGVVDESVRAMGAHRFGIVQDVVIPIQHFLMKRKDISEGKLMQMMAHPQVFKQCRRGLENVYTNLEQVTGEGELQDTAKGAKALADGGLPKTTAILGPKRLAELYDLDIIAKNLQDDRVNDTHFLLVQAA